MHGQQFPWKVTFLQACMSDQQDRTADKTHIQFMLETQGPQDKSEGKSRVENIEVGVWVAQ